MLIYVSKPRGLKRVFYSYKLSQSTLLTLLSVEWKFDCDDKLQTGCLKDVQQKHSHRARDIAQW